MAAAGRYVARGVIPATVCCWLHFERCGPQTDLPATRAMRLLDAYPAQLRDQDWYRELRIAVLDGYARRAWTAGRYAEARLLWQESARLDPYRLPVAVNLLLVAARTRATDGYAPAWERLLELLYLLPAGAGDVQLHLAERRDLHLAVSQQSSRRYWSGSGLGPTSDELDAWLADPDALRTWLVEWDRWYLNARLSFRSPLHLLGMALDASAPAVVEARDGLLGQVDRAVGGQPWAGVAVFRELTGAVVTDAFEQAREPVERLRDAHHEPESDRAEALDEELLRRTFTLRQLLGAVARAEQPGEHLALACDIARRLFTPPRSAVHAVWAGANVIEQDDDLTEILEVGLINVAAQWDRPEPADPAGWTRRLSGLDECVALLPHRIEPRLLRCEAQYRAGRPAEAYAGALDALGLPPRGDDDEAIRTRLVDLVDEAGFTDVPESLRQPRDLPTLDRAVAAASSSLGRYPRSGLLRRFLVQLLLAGPAQDRYRRSARLLVAGIADALDDRQRDRCHELFDRIPQADATAAVRQEVTRIKQAADDRLNNAVDALRRDPERVGLRATIREVVAPELPRGVRTAELARRSRLAMESRQLEETANRLGWPQMRI